MTYTEAREHTKGRLHELFSDPYEAFDNDSPERLLHLRVMLYLFVARPMERGLLTLRVLHGWENGNDDPGLLASTDYALHSLDALRHAHDDFYGPRQAPTQQLFSASLQQAIEAARQAGQTLDDDITLNPARWPTFERGLALYTLFKMCHRLIYGEDDFYRSSQCQTRDGLREIHEFHLEEGEFAFLLPRGRAFVEEETLLVLHESQLEPIRQLLETHLPLFRHI